MLAFGDLAMLAFGGLAMLFFGGFASVRESALVTWAGKRTDLSEYNNRQGKQTNIGATPAYPLRTRVLVNENRDAVLIRLGAAGVNGPDSSRHSKSMPSIKAPLRAAARNCFDKAIDLVRQKLRTDATNHLDGEKHPIPDPHPARLAIPPERERAMA